MGGKSGSIEVILMLVGANLVPGFAGAYGEPSGTEGGKHQGNLRIRLLRLLEACQYPWEPVGTSEVWEPHAYVPGVAILQHKADPLDLQDPLCWSTFPT